MEHKRGEGPRMTFFKKKPKLRALSLSVVKLTVSKYSVVFSHLYQGFLFLIRGPFIACYIIALVCYCMSYVL